MLALLLAEPASALPLSVKRVAVLQFETSHVGASGMTASDQFGTYLQKDFPGLSVVERTRLAKLLSEQQLQHLSGLVDKDSALRLQSLLGVDSVVIGSIVAMSLEVEGGGGTMMMTARLVDTSSGRILWAETRTVKVGMTFLKRLARGFSGAPGESDALVTNRLIQKAALELVQDLGRRLSPKVLAPDPAVVAAEFKAAAPKESEADSCGGVDAKVAALGEDILSDEALYWAHRMRREDSIEATPGAGYPDSLRQRLTTKVLFWLGERDLPKLSARQAERVAGAKTKMRELYSLCGRSTVAKFIGPPSPVR